jgi:hypothetical protein
MLRSQGLACPGRCRGCNFVAVGWLYNWGRCWWRDDDTFLVQLSEPPPRCCPLRAFAAEEDGT